MEKNMEENEVMKNNLIRLIQSGDESQLELAIQLNIGLRLLDWEDMFFMIRTFYNGIGKSMLVRKNIDHFNTEDIQERLLVAYLLFGNMPDDKRRKYADILKNIKIC